MSKDITICTLEDYVEGAYRYFCLRNIRTLPNAETIFLIVIDMLESQHVMHSGIYCRNLKVQIPCKDIMLQDVALILNNQRMEFFDEEECKERFIAQKTLIGDFD